MRRAIFSQRRNDMFWKLFDLDDGYIKWVGYDDRHWWDNVSPNLPVRIGPVSGRKYQLNPVSNEVTVTDA